MGATTYVDDKDGVEVPVSTHAPVMGATTSSEGATPAFAVSTHAPVMGATLGRPFDGLAPACFNPRARDGRDHIARGRAGLRRDVSTHAPVMGATKEKYVA